MVLFQFCSVLKKICQFSSWFSKNGGRTRLNWTSATLCIVFVGWMPSSSCLSFSWAYSCICNCCCHELTCSCSCFHVCICLRWGEGICGGGKWKVYIHSGCDSPGPPFVGSSLTHSSPQCLAVTAGWKAAVVTGASEPPPTCPHSLWALKPDHMRSLPTLFI